MGDIVTDPKIPVCVHSSVVHKDKFSHPELDGPEDRLEALRRIKRRISDIPGGSAVPRDIFVYIVMLSSCQNANAEISLKFTFIRKIYLEYFRIFRF